MTNYEPEYKRLLKEQGVLSDKEIDEAWANLLEQCMNRGEPIESFEGLSWCTHIDMAFIWARTIQGYAYWADIYRRQNNG